MDALVHAGADVDRARRAVFRSDGRRPGDPARLRARARAGRGLGDVLDVVAQFRRRDTTTPIVLMGYANPIEAMGVRASPIARAPPASTACSSSTIRRRRRPSSPRSCDARDIAPIFLLAPTTPDARIARDRALARGYVYYVSLKGVTGAGHLDTADGRAQARRDPPARDAAGRRRLRHSRRRTARARSPRTPTPS